MFYRLPPILPSLIPFPQKGTETMLAETPANVKATRRSRDATQQTHSSPAQIRPPAVIIPAAREVRAGKDYAELSAKCAFALAHPAAAFVRLTRPIGGERFACRIVLHARPSGEVWAAAEYRSLSVKGHVRRLLITPDGQPFTLLQSQGKVTSRRDKYNAHLNAALVEIAGRE